MAISYIVYNGAMPTTGGPPTGVTSSASIYTQLQIVPSANTPAKIIEWGVSFNASALAAGFPCMLAETGSVAASVTAYAVADVMLYGDPNAPVQSGTATTSVPLNIAANLSGYTSTSENSITAMRIFDPQTVEPIGGYWKQFPLGREPLIKPGNVCRIMVKGDNTTKCVCYLVFEV